MKPQDNTANESLLLTHDTLLFRSEHPETVQLWESQLGKGEAGPDLHFCHHALEAYKNLCAQLDCTGYRIGFAINAHILHAHWQQQFLTDGLSGPLAVEQANVEIHLIYRALDGDDLSGKAAILRSLQGTN